ncbi:hypothetical protein CISG_05963 [Coccidioides immitis RMSCC 3703]|uniref:Uncharacterized protein n=1 Tax=Coccidioides immitis RMSCC 3703 TaxID=454286 RepID=A0A0J8QY00_COCIT|nr:hypothetical protein CISG_05963 [Coccidioides immitis RMSCC 3703]
MASGNSISRRRTHNLLLLSSLLNQRDTASPLTLLLDSLEQPATPLLREYIRRARLSKSQVTFVSFETFTRPEGVDSFLSATRKSPNEVAKEVVASFPPRDDKFPDKRTLVIIDSIHPLVCRKGAGQEVNVAEFLSNGRKRDDFDEEEDENLKPRTEKHCFTNNLLHGRWHIYGDGQWNLRAATACL